MHFYQTVPLVILIALPPSSAMTYGISFTNSSTIKMGFSGYSKVFDEARLHH